MTQERRESQLKVHHETSYKCEQLELNLFGKLWESGLHHLKGEGDRVPQAKEHRSWQKLGSQREVLWRLRARG